MLGVKHLNLDNWIILALVLFGLCVVFAVLTSAASARPQGPNPKLCSCPDCKRDVSRRALSCPHCGCPFKRPRSFEPHDKIRDHGRNVRA